MKRCPKCGGTRILGPTYCRGGWDRIWDCPDRYSSEEHLVYRCERCGYAETRPCHDAEEARERAG